MEGPRRIVSLQNGEEKDKHIICQPKQNGLQAMAEEKNEWDEPYLESCCRSALHRLKLSGAAGRPGALADSPCLERLTSDGFAVTDTQGRYRLTSEGIERYEIEVRRMLRRRGLHNRARQRARFWRWLLSLSRR